MNAKTVGWIVVTFAVLVVAGGAAGYLKEGSTVSLWSALGCGIALAAAGWMIGAGRPGGRHLAMTVCSAIALFFAYRFASSGKMMPALPVIVLSVSTALTVWRSKPASG